MSLKNILNVNDMKVIAKKRVPKMFFDYVESGSWEESTLRSNVDDFSKIKLKQKVAIDVSNRNTMVNIFGQKYTMPVALAPAGLTGLQKADGEILAALAAEKFNVPYTLSTFSICSLESVAKKVSKPFWFQLYIMKDKKFMKELIFRAKNVNCSALMITLDLQVLGKRYKDVRNRLSIPPDFLCRKNLFNMLLKPYWMMEILSTKNRGFGNIVGHASGVSNLKSLSKWVGDSFDESFCWEDIEKIRANWKEKLILKGILDEEDALKAVQIGADAIIVSNHGGRQLDSTSSSISMLHKIKKVVKEDVEIWIDGGITSGIDVIKACSLGADCTLIGRPYLYGLGAYGEKGVTKILNIFKEDLDLSMALCGKTNIKDLNSENIIVDF